MEIKSIERPWQKAHNWGNKQNPDSVYHTREWKHTREAFKRSEPINPPPPIGYLKYTNYHCYECWLKGKINTERIHVDHIVRIKDGGSLTDFSNLQSLCYYHNNAKDNNKDR